jgi:hypothetical protein
VPDAGGRISLAGAAVILVLYAASLLIFSLLA